MKDILLHRKRMEHKLSLLSLVELARILQPHINRTRKNLFFLRCPVAKKDWYHIKIQASGNGQSARLLGPTRERTLTVPLHGPPSEGFPNFMALVRIRLISIEMPLHLRRHPWSAQSMRAIPHLHMPQNLRRSCLLQLPSSRDRFSQNHGPYLRPT